MTAAFALIDVHNADTQWIAEHHVSLKGAQIVAIPSCTEDLVVFIKGDDTPRSLGRPVFIIVDPKGRSFQIKTARWPKGRQPVKVTLVPGVTSWDSRRY